MQREKIAQTSFQVERVRERNQKSMSGNFLSWQNRKEPVSPVVVDHWRRCYKSGNPLGRIQLRFQANQSCVSKSGESFTQFSHVMAKNKNSEKRKTQ